MLSNSVIDNDEFLEMPLSSQALYFHLNRKADDEGFLGNVKSIIKLVGAREDDLKILIAKRYVLMFKSGVVVIKHWLIHNTLRQDRVKETTYVEERSQLGINEFGAYTEKIKPEGLFDDGYGDTSKMAVISITQPTIQSVVETTKDNLKVAVKEIIDYLNFKTGSRYRYDNTATIKHIKARLDGKFTIEDFKRVIDTKCDEWIGTEMEKFLRPDTLFAPSKFEGYLNQKKAKKDNNKIIKQSYREGEAII